MRIALVGKYVQLEDAYLSVVEALRHAGVHHGCKVEVDWVDSETVGEPEVDRAAADRRRDPDPRRLRRPRLGGQDPRRADRPRAPDPVSRHLPGHARRGQRVRPQRGRDGGRQLDRDGPRDALPGDRPAPRAEGDRRHGRHHAPRAPTRSSSTTAPGSAQLYGEAVVYERHRHRYEVNNHLRKRLEAAGLVCSGTSPDERLVEAVELPAEDHPFYVASQYHPEFKSRPERPAPLFREFVGAALAHARHAAPRRSRVRGACRRRARRQRLAPAAVRLARGEAGQRDRARAAARDVRGAVPDPEPVRARAGLRRLGDGRARGDRASRSTRTTAGAAAGSEAGNLLARIPGRDPGSVLICAHLDTVPPVAPIEPVLTDGYWENANAGILGADNKSAVAVALELARRLTSAPEPPPVGRRAPVHGLRGGLAARLARVRRRDAAQSRSATCSTTPRRSARSWSASPTHYRIVAEFRGRAAHAGVRPEAGRSAVVAAARAIAAHAPGPARRRRRPPTSA